MILGHYGAAFAAKRIAPRTSLGTMSFAAQLSDLLWPLLLLVGLERVEIVPGLMRMSPLDFVHYPISHSLLAVVAWGVLLGGIYYARTRYPRGAWVVGALVVSHWLLDLPMHRPDLPLWPGDSPMVGLGLWNSFAATLTIELALFAIGLFVYVRTTRPRDRIGSWALAGLVAFLLVIYLGGLTSPPPRDARSMQASVLGLWLFVPWSYWIDRHREPRAAATT